jgi:hypothetical protein
VDEDVLATAVEPDEAEPLLRIVPCDRTYAFFDLPVAGPTLARAEPLERHGTLLQPANVDVDLFDRRRLVVAPYRRAAMRTMLRLCCGAPIGSDRSRGSSRCTDLDQGARYLSGLKGGFDHEGGLHDQDRNYLRQGVADHRAGEIES